MPVDKSTVINSSRNFSSWKSNTVERLLPENHRERLFSPTKPLSMFLTQAVSPDPSCQNAVNRSAVARCQAGLARCSNSTSGFSCARERMPLALAQELSIECARANSDAVPTDWQFRGRPARLVDGATIALPDTPENQAQYPQPSSQEPGAGRPAVPLIRTLWMQPASITPGKQCSHQGPLSSATLSRATCLSPLLVAGAIRWCKPRSWRRQRVSWRRSWRRACRVVLHRKVHSWLCSLHSALPRRWRSLPG